MCCFRGKYVSSPYLQVYYPPAIVIQVSLRQKSWKRQVVQNSFSLNKNCPRRLLRNFCSIFFLVNRALNRNINFIYIYIKKENWQHFSLILWQNIIEFWCLTTPVPCWRKKSVCKLWVKVKVLCLFFCVVVLDRTAFADACFWAFGRFVFEIFVYDEISRSRISVPKEKKNTDVIRICKMWKKYAKLLRNNVVEFESSLSKCSLKIWYWLRLFSFKF